MRTKLLLASIFLTAAYASSGARHVSTALHLRMFDGRPISVMVDGLPRGTAASQHEILNLSPGIHRLKVFAVQYHPFGWQGSMIPVFRGRVEVFEGFATIAVIQRWNSLVIEDYEALYAEPVQPPCAPPVYLPSPCGAQYPVNNSGYCGSDCANYSAGFFHPGAGFRYPMSQDDFNQLLRVIGAKTFESTRQEIALGAISSNYFTSEQVRQILKTFSFETTKIEVAKRAYNRVVDPDKYYVVYDAFTFESSINDLQASLGP